MLLCLGSELASANGQPAAGSEATHITGH